MHGDGVAAPGLEDRVRIGLSRAADVAALGVENDGAIFRQVTQRLVEQPARLPPPSLVEREVQLVRRHRVADRIHHRPDEACDAGWRALDRRRKQIRLRVEAEAKERAGDIFTGA